MKEELTEPQLTIIGSKGWPGATFSVLSCVFVWGSSRTDADIGETSRSVLLVGDGG